MPALIPEDGTGLPNADSFCSVEFANAYHAAYSSSADAVQWASLGTDQKAQLLRRATVYINSRYRMRWYGRRLKPTQALEWPRFNSSDSQGYGVPADVVPVSVQNATALMALRAAQDDLAPKLARGGEVQSYSRSQNFGGLVSESTTYAAGAPSATTYPELLELLGALLSPYRSVRA